MSRYLIFQVKDRGDDLFELWEDNGKFVYKMIYADGQVMCEEYCLTFREAFLRLTRQVWLDHSLFDESFSLKLT